MDKHSLYMASVLKTLDINIVRLRFLFNEASTVVEKIGIRNGSSVKF